MKVYHDEITDELLAMLAVLKYPVLRHDLMSLMASEIIRSTFPTLSASEYAEYLLPGNIMAKYSGIIEYSYDHHTYVLAETCDIETLARQALLKEPRLAGVIAAKVPWQSCPEAELGLLRDIRNYYYAQDNDAVCRRLQLFFSLNSRQFCNGVPFEFLLPQMNEEWLADYPEELFALAVEYLLPLAVAQLMDVRPFLKTIARRQQTLGQSAILSVMDCYLLQGNLKGAQALLARVSREARELREAWMDFLAGENERSIERYLELLQRVRAVSGNTAFYFQSTGGIFLIFALIRNGQKRRLELAAEYCENGLDTPFLGAAYASLKACLKQRGVKTETIEADTQVLEDDSLRPLTRFFVELARLWTMKKTKNLTFLEEQAARCDEIYPWIAREMRTILSVYTGVPLANGILPDVRGIVDCIALPPRWKRVITKVEEIYQKCQEESECRLCWLCAVDYQQDGGVTLRPMEQRLTRNGHWSKGRYFPLLRYQEDRCWPEYFSLQDQLIASIILDEYRKDKSIERRAGCFASLKALEAAVHHPALYWDKERTSNIICSRFKPILKIQERSGELEFSVYPEYHNPEAGIVAITEGTDEIALYLFGRRQAEIANAVGAFFTIASQDAASLIPFICAVAHDMSVLSEIPLDFMGILPSESDRTLHFRLLPHEKQMSVMLYLEPFGGACGHYPPGGGAREFICQENGRVIRKVRDFEAERQASQELVAACECLDPSTETGNFTWELPTLEHCYRFTLSLQTVMDHIQIHWPDNQQMKISRRLTMKNLSVSCHSTNDWLFSLDGSVKLEDGLLVSLKELLKAVKKGEGNFIQLEDGQIVALAESFSRRLRDFAAVTNETEEGISFGKFAIPFIETLLGEEENWQDGNGVFRHQAEAIREALKLEPSVPSTLQATLRSYQKEGYIWLCQLDAWGAGACLADDMGLGKTIQTIAFMLHCAEEGPILVVAPTSVCSNWMQELQKFAPSLTVLAFGGTRRKELLEEVKARTVLVTSYGLLQSEEEAFQNIPWRVAVLDEAQAIKNHNAKRSQAVLNLKARFRIATTGTPMENNLGELWSIFNFINPGLLGSFAEFQNQFALPIEKGKDKELLTRLSTIVRPFILRRLKKQVLTDLPPKTEVQLSIELSEEERAFYEALRQKLVEEIRAFNAPAGQMRLRTIAAITKLRLAACNPSLILENSPIPSSKLSTFIELVEELVAGGHRVLVFSQFVRHLSLIRSVLEEKGIRYQYLDGSTPAAERKIAVDTFQQGNDELFLISLKAGGLGLNLTAADYVIHLDPWWNPAVEDQASDRAHRIGQTRPVTIYRLIAQNTIEDKILELHNSKRELADTLLEGTDSIEKITQEELLRLLEEK